MMQYDSLCRHLLFLLSSTSLCLIVSGCGGNDGPELIPAGGFVNYQGRPLAGARVTFVPEEEGSIAMATTDAEGRFELKTGVELGVAAGQCGVSVIMFEAGVDNPLPPTMTPEDMQMMAMEGTLDEAREQQANSLLPERYGTAATSGLTFEVKRGEENQFVIDLVD